MIESDLETTAEPRMVHELLVDVASWRLWSPHIASVDSSADRIETGWAGRTRAFFAPMSTSMVRLFASSFRPSTFSDNSSRGTT